MSAGPVSDTSQYWERQPYGVVLGKQFGDYEWFIGDSLIRTDPLPETLLKSNLWTLCQTIANSTH